VQSDGSHLPHTTHLTVTPVTAERIDELEAVLRASAAEVRGIPAVPAGDLLAALPADLLGGLADGSATLDSETALQVLKQIGLVGVEDGPGSASARLPERMAPFLALIEALPHALTERLLIELLARIVEPR
jgi:hypothetical protein